jgi:L-Ala-D/L-Glu epimerase
MITASYKKYILNFKEKQGVGECGLFRGLSVDDRPDYEEKLQWLCNNINQNLDYLLNKLIEFPSIQFGLETALKSLESSNIFELFPSKFTQSDDVIPINGLIWMGTEAFMKQQIQEKIDAGFSCIKMKIGAIDFEAEINLLKSIRNEFTSKDIELRVDANGAFSPSEALEKLKMLSDLDLHSIEQPIKKGQIEAMAKLCEETPLPIALDEELIGIFPTSKKQALLDTIKPQYIILKPSLVGGFKGTDEWIEVAEKQHLGWWITSALESNVGLNAIAQYTYKKQSKLPQGLGTGSLFTNNFDSPLQVKNGTLQYSNKTNWKFNL